MRIKVTQAMVTKANLMLVQFDEIETRMRQANDLIMSLQSEDEWAGLTQSVGAQSFTAAMQQTLQTIATHREIATYVIATHASHTQLDHDNATHLPRLD